MFDLIVVVLILLDFRISGIEDSLFYCGLFDLLSLGKGGLRLEWCVVTLSSGLLLFKRGWFN